MATPEEVRLYETLTLDTAPTLSEEVIDGWRLRASGTDTRRSNSATFLDTSVANENHDATIDAIERWFAAHDQPAVFRLNRELVPQSFEKALTARGYGHAIDCLFMTKQVDAPAVAVLPEGSTFEVVTLDVGMTLLHELKSMDAAKGALEIQRQRQWLGRQRFYFLKIDGVVAAMGLGRIEAGYLGIFSMHTVRAFRGRGLAANMLNELCRWGRTEGVQTAFLQVELDNKVAVSVYEKAGFVPAYSYWHRLK